jgi:hypothetical protein
MDDIQRQLRNSPEFVILNWPDVNKISDIRENEWWVWAGFTKPGKHNVVIKGLNNGYYRRNIAVNVREGELEKLNQLENGIKIIAELNDD